MAPIKRTRPRPEDDDGDIVAVDTATSSLREDTQRKRARLSGQHQPAPKHQNYRHEQTSSPSEPRESPAPRVREQELPASTQHDIDRDASFAHLRNPDRDDERATQRLLARNQLLGENHAAENGIIESVTMVNFMCHDKLHVSLGPLINFIIGMNGSGKSAILTAVTLCLGAKASTTNRGGSLKSLIKEGRDQASLMVRLKNQGPDAYKPDLYGESIIVERNFSKAGTSGFKLKSAAGRIISSKKADVDEIIEYFQMQIDNPMSVLTQDASRQFLTNSTPSQKYKFFVKGVQLEQLDNDYRIVSDIADAIKVKLEDEKNQIEFLKKRAEAAQRKAKIVTQHQGIRDKVRLYGKQMAWAQVEEQEFLLQERERLVMEAQGRIDEADREVTQKDGTFQQSNEAAERAESGLKLLRDEMVPLQEAESEAKTAFEAATQEVQTTHTQHRQIRDLLTAAKKKSQSIQKDIDDELQRMENAHGGAHAQKMAALATAQEELNEAKVLVSESAGKIPELEQQRRLAVENHDKSNGPIESKKKEILLCENRLQSLDRDVGQVMAGFDPKILRLLNMIRDDASFTEKPVGPIGLHIKLLKPIWSNVLERSIGNLLNGFVVTSKYDQQKLSSMMRQLNLDNCPVVIGNHQPLDTRGHEPDEQYDTVLRILEIDNDLIKNQLILTQGIEQTILVEQRQAAMRVMYDGPKPHHVKQCFCLHESRRGWGIRLGYMIGSNEGSSSPVKPPDGKPRMKTDLDSQIAYQKDSLKQLRFEMNTLQSRQRELHQAVQRCSQAITHHKRAHTTFEIKLRDAEENLEILQEDLDRDNVEDGRLDGLKAYLADAEEEFRIHSGSYGEAVLAKEKQNTISIALKRELDIIKERIADHEATIVKSEAKSRRIQQARQIALQQKNVAVDAVDERKAEKSKAEDKRELQSARIAEFTKQASKIGSRVQIPAGETAKTLDKKIAAANEAIKNYSNKLGATDSEILQASEEAEKALYKAKKQSADMGALYKALKAAYLRRLDMWRKFQQHVSSQSRINFTYLLSERGFRGKLQIDHKKHLLELQVEPDETRRSAAGRATKTLSGGEKSYSNVCLVLSLWDAMGAPVRCMDEFDVFMDSVNRDVSTKLLIGGARRAVGKQFIFITPNAIGGGVEHDKDLKIIKLVDPRQTLLADH